MQINKKRVQRGKQRGVVSSSGPKPKTRPNKKQKKQKNGRGCAEKWRVREATYQVWFISFALDLIKTGASVSRLMNDQRTEALRVHEAMVGWRAQVQRTYKN
jgi:hypothetical protein